MHHQRHHDVLDYSPQFHLVMLPTTPTTCGKRLPTSSQRRGYSPSRTTWPEATCILRPTTPVQQYEPRLTRDASPRRRAKTSRNDRATLSNDALKVHLQRVSYDPLTQKERIRLTGFRVRGWSVQNNGVLHPPAETDVTRHHVRSNGMDSVAMPQPQKMTPATTKFTASHAPPSPPPTPPEEVRRPTTSTGTATKIARKPVPNIWPFHPSTPVASRPSTSAGPVVAPPSPPSTVSDRSEQKQTPHSFWEWDDSDDEDSEKPIVRWVHSIQRGSAKKAKAEAKSRRSAEEGAWPSRREGSESSGTKLPERERGRSFSGLLCGVA